MKKLKRKLGQFYWNAVKTFHHCRHCFKKNAQSFANWLRGFRRYAWDLSAAESAHSVVVCAHPDDETIFFYSVLRKEKPFVICMSGRGNRIRFQEFHNALEAQGVHGMLLNMPDVPHMVWAWRLFGAFALKKAAKHCHAAHQIYTHSNTGESLHPHHYATHAAATKAFSNCRIISTAAIIPNNGDGTLSPEDIRRKHGILKACYPSQMKMLETWCPWWDSYLKTEFFKE